MAFYINSENNEGSILTYNTLPHYAKMNTIISCPTTESQLLQQRRYAESSLYKKFIEAFNWWGKGNSTNTTGYKGFSKPPIKLKPIIPEGTKILSPEELMSKLINYTSNNLDDLIEQYINNPIISNYINGLGMGQYVIETINNNNYEEKLTHTLRLFSIIVQPEPSNETMNSDDANPIPYYRILILAIAIGQIGSATISLSSWKTPRQKEIEYACDHNQGTPNWLSCNCTDPPTDFSKAACTKIGANK